MTIRGLDRMLYSLGYWRPYEVVSRNFILITSANFTYPLAVYRRRAIVVYHTL